jgi:hypothetical protein
MVQQVLHAQVALQAERQPSAGRSDAGIDEQAVNLVFAKARSLIAVRVASAASPIVDL